ncbi:hypothetical protein RFI_29951 [Reticulomyxa filosa]|uniref:Uncharacterized protein n=1 Tax=Reticulomyxa filosa TaxID=46433 RepID=X6M1H7_RETFI|nr:hypothetical protein RFI_29951 [Reticulomyxa filosa]|eukprot:ETO07441.1 hypothetical protein RFI_29951 [Reticulomyxa filosa]
MTTNPFVLAQLIQNFVDFNGNKQIGSFNGHSNSVSCVKFSSYHYHKYCQNVIYFIQVQIFHEHAQGCVELNFHHLIMVDICVLDHMTILFIYGMLKHKIIACFNGHTNGVLCVDISQSQSKNDNCISVIVCNGHTGIVYAVEFSSFMNSESNSYDETIMFKPNIICSGSIDNTTRVWDIRTSK